MLEQPIDEIIEGEANKNTKQKTSRDIKLFAEFLKLKGIKTDVDDLDNNLLDECLSEFVFRVRRNDGKEYEPTSIRGIISSIQRYINIKAPSRAINLATDRAFTRSQNALKAKYKLLKKQGKGEKPHEASPLSDEDVDILYSKKLLGISSPESLINTLWYNNCFYFGMRGCTENRNMKWGDVSLNVDCDGKEFIEKNIERQTKTRQGDDVRNIRQQKGRMYAVEGSNRCPVETYKFYRDMRPSGMNTDDSPFYLAINIIKPDSLRCWFKASPMGVNKINSLMKTMAEKAGLKTANLTNHSVRKRLVQKLVSSDIPPTEIMQITGHKNIQSINNYSSLDNSKKRKLSNILSGAKDGSSTSTSTSNLSSYNNLVNNNLLVPPINNQSESVQLQTNDASRRNLIGSNLAEQLYNVINSHLSSVAAPNIINQQQLPLPNSFLQNPIFLAPVNFNFGSQQQSSSVTASSSSSSFPPQKKKRIIIESDSDSDSD